MLDREEGLIRNSYYAASVPLTHALPPLVGPTSADVCVIGAGFAGLSAAIELARRGYAVVVLEAERIGWGASGRNGGQVVVGHASEQAIEQQLGAADAKRAWDVSVEGLRLLRERIADYQIECEFEPGFLSLAVSAAKARALRDWQLAAERAYAYPHWRWIEHAEIGDWIASPRYYAGLHDAFSGHLHPLKYCLGLARAARAEGVRIFENSRVRAIRRGASPQVATAGGSVRCDFVVLAGNVYLGGLAPELDAHIMPAGTYIVASEPLPAQRADSLIRDRAAVSDTNFVIEYFRLSHDNRLLFGGRVSYSTMTPRNLVRGIRARMQRVFPQLDPQIRIDYAWGGFVDITMNRAPDFGRLAPNIYYLQGFCGHGVALTGMAGRLAAEAIAGQAERFDLYARLAHHAFPGGRLLRTPALVLGMLYYRIRDLL